MLEETHKGQSSEIWKGSWWVALARQVAFDLSLVAADFHRQVRELQLEVADGCSLVC